MSTPMSLQDFPLPLPNEAWDYVVTEQIGYLLRRAYQRHLAIFQTNSCDSQLTSTQFVTLCVLGSNGPSNQNEIVNATGIDQATIRGIIDRLKRRNLISYVADKTDRRKVVIALTEDGQQLLGKMLPCARRISELTMGGLSPVEQIALLAILKKMIGSF